MRYFVQPIESFNLGQFKIVGSCITGCPGELEETLLLPTASQVAREVDLPGTAARDKRLHDGFLGLDGVVQIVGGPFIEHLLECHRAQLGMAGRPLKISRADACQRLQAFCPQLGKFGRQTGGLLIRLRFGAFRIRVEGRKIAPIQEGLQA
ncbi:MAG TPA: hypothetical protein VKF38_12930, partial [Anaerolineaceae bacterium]|nr:hypothetical protein [Anaerolineaceae bacterium]